MKARVDQDIPPLLARSARNRHHGRLFCDNKQEESKGASGAITLACGILGLVLFRWTPTTGEGILIYVALFAVLVVMAIALSSRKRAGYWPNKPEDRT
jgi:hypothetical protein